jgi:hypothetical protein
VLENGEMPKFGTQGSFVFVCFKLGNWIYFISSGKLN